MEVADYVKNINLRLLKPETPRPSGFRALNNLARRAGIHLEMWMTRLPEDQDAMQRRLEIDDAELPALWDADFLYGPKSPEGEDTYVLCEINVSAVSPFPDSAAPKAARAALLGTLAARAKRRSVS